LIGSFHRCLYLSVHTHDSLRLQTRVPTPAVAYSCLFISFRSYDLPPFFFPASMFSISLSLLLSLSPPIFPSDSRLISSSCYPSTQILPFCLSLSFVSSSSPSGVFPVYFLFCPKTDSCLFLLPHFFLLSFLCQSSFPPCCPFFALCFLCASVHVAILNRPKFRLKP